MYCRQGPGAPINGTWNKKKKYKAENDYACEPGASVPTSSAMWSFGSSASLMTYLPHSDVAYWLIYNQYWGKQRRGERPGAGCETNRSPPKIRGSDKSQGRSRDFPKGYLCSSSLCWSTYLRGCYSDRFFLVFPLGACSFVTATTQAGYLKTAANLRNKTKNLNWEECACCACPFLCNSPRAVWWGKLRPNTSKWDQKWDTGGLWKHSMSRNCCQIIVGSVYLVSEGKAVL